MTKPIHFSVRSAPGACRGFTLLELLVVLVVMGLLTAVVTPQVMNMFSGAKSDTAALQVETITTALNYYRIDTGSYPDSNRSLSGVLCPPAPTRNNPSHIHQGGAGSDQGDSDQQQVAAA